MVSIAEAETRETATMTVKGTVLASAATEESPTIAPAAKTAVEATEAVVAAVETEALEVTETSTIAASEAELVRMESMPTSEAEATRLLHGYMYVWRTSVAVAF